MINTLLGIKRGMTSTYDARGRRVGATIIEIQPNLVAQVKSAEGKDGYSAVQLGIGTKKSVRKPQLGHLKKNNIKQKIKWLKEIRTESSDLKPGQEIKVNAVFSAGDCVKVIGNSKGRGFQGGVRRWGFAGGPKTHGQSDRLRAPGSIGQTTTPGLVYKGKHMAGHMGTSRVSVRGLEVIKVDKQNNLLVVKGGIPGAMEQLLIIEKLGKMKGYTPPPEEKTDEDNAEPSDAKAMAGKVNDEQAEGKNTEQTEKNPEEVKNEEQVQPKEKAENA